MQTLYFNPEQTRELMGIYPNALVVMQHYVAIGKQVNPVMEDAQIANLLNLSESAVKKVRLALTKAGWFKRTKFKSGNDTQIIYAVGKQAVSQKSHAVILP